MSTTIKILPSLSGKIGIIELNQPKIFHSLDMDMIEALRMILKEWHSSPSLKAILIKSTEAKRPVFCAGGNVKSVYDDGMTAGGAHGKGTPGLYSSDFFRREYLLDHAIASWDRPYVALWDGIVMGGGVGITIHDKYRVCTENTVFAMPETGIGLFPDVGSMYWMPRLLSWGMASYLALTGTRLEAPDLMHTGIATHYIPSNRLKDFQQELVKASETTNHDDDVVAPVIASFHETNKDDTSSSFLATHSEAIEELFRETDRMEDIVARLQTRGDDFSKATLGSLQKMSPTSLKVTLEGLKRGKAMPSLAEDFKMEYRMSQAFMREGSDFFRGIRAVLVDKDNNPRWTPSTLKEVTPEMVESYFADLGQHEWTLPDNNNNNSNL